MKSWPRITGLGGVGVSAISVVGVQPSSSCWGWRDQGDRNDDGGGGGGSGGGGTSSLGGGGCSALGATAAMAAISTRGDGGTTAEARQMRVRLQRGMDSHYNGVSAIRAIARATGQESRRDCPSLNVVQQPQAAPTFVVQQPQAASRREGPSAVA